MKKLILSLLIPALAGCAHYHLGTTLPGNLRTVRVETFTNSTTQIDIEIDITDAVITRFRQDGNLQPVSTPDADCLLSGKIVGWTRRVMGTTGSDDDEVDEYRLIVRARVSLFNNNTGEFMVRNQVVQGKTDFFVEGNLPESEEAAKPDAYRDLAREVVDAVISIW